MALSPPPFPPRRTGKFAGPLRWIRRYLGYSRNEARGMVGLLALMLVLIITPMLLRPALPVYLPEADQRELNELAASLQEHRRVNLYDVSRFPRAKDGPAERGRPHFAPVAQVRLAPFDPNALTDNDWEARGVPHFVAARLVKYRTAAGGFKSKAQLKKMYGLTDSVYQRLAPFLQLPDETPKREWPAHATSKPGTDGKFPFSANAGATSKFPRKPRSLQPFDLNTADTTQLMQIRGIGTGRAKWVVKYRNQLGGYLREEQLDEIFVLRDAPDLRDSLRKYTFVSPGFAPQPVNVNTATFDELYLHPYIGKPRARLIVAYRQQHGPFKRIEDLQRMPTLKMADWEKMRPYLRCE